MDKLIRSSRGSDEEEAQVRAYGEEIATFIRRRWVEREWETAWFVNPPVSSVVFAAVTASCGTAHAAC